MKWNACFQCLSNFERQQLCGFFYVSFQFKRDSDSTVDSIGKISINICELKQYKLFNYGVLTKKEHSLENVSTAI